MHYLIENITLAADEQQDIRNKVTLLLNKFNIKILKLSIAKRSIDARDKAKIKIIYHVIIETEHPFNIKKLKQLKISPYMPKDISIHRQRCKPNHRPVIVGMGPSGLFCALRLCEHGVPSLLLERGNPVEQRTRDVARLWEQGQLEDDSNALFGEGGAGTFSDGKLTTQINDPLNQYILKKLVSFGAPEDISYDAKPHIGTDKFRQVLINLRNYLSETGTEILFQTKLDRVVSSANGLLIASSANAEFVTDTIFLGIGHSAHDTYASLLPDVAMTAKPFAIGFRVEHPQQLINEIQFGTENSRNANLGPATYKLTHQTSQGRHVFSFCMCPGGQVICASNQSNRLVVNGMSNYQRNSGFANSALIVNIVPEDYFVTSPLDGLDFIKAFEEQAYALGGENFTAPAQKLTDFIQNKLTTGAISSTYLPKTTPANLRTIYPDYVNNALTEGLSTFDRKMKGFISQEAVLIGVETRTSSPIRIPRGQNGEHIRIKGLYPMGEGAGYAGGIMSAALDGIKAADHYVNNNFT